MMSISYTVSSLHGMFTFSLSPLTRKNADTRFYIWQPIWSYFIPWYQFPIVIFFPFTSPSFISLSYLTHTTGQVMRMIRGAHVYARTSRLIVPEIVYVCDLWPYYATFLTCLKVVSPNFWTQEFSTGIYDFWKFHWKVCILKKFMCNHCIAG